MTNVETLNKTILILSLFFLISCDSKEKVKENTSTKFEMFFTSALENGRFFKINNLYGLIYSDNFYLLSDSEVGFTNDKFMFHLIRHDGSFDNLSFFKDKYLVEESKKGIFKKIAIMKLKIDSHLYKKIRVGQFDATNISKGNIWAKEILLKNKNKIGEFYKNQFNNLININVLKNEFKTSLNKGRFFKISNDFYISLLKNKMFIISNRHKNLNNKMMLHLVKCDNTFTNLDFHFKHAEISEFLSLKEYRVAKVLFDDVSEYNKIRIGQSNSKGNLWAQEIVINEVLSNELLIYNDELKLNY